MIRGATILWTFHPGRPFRYGCRVEVRSTYHTLPEKNKYWPWYRKLRQCLVFYRAWETHGTEVWQLGPLSVRFPMTMTCYERLVRDYGKDVADDMEKKVQEWVRALGR